MQAAPASLLPACHQRWVQASTSSLLTSIGLKNEIARDDHANRKPRSDSQRGRNVELSAHDLLARIVDRVLPAIPNCADQRSEEHTSELQSLMRISYAVFCLKK